MEKELQVANQKSERVLAEVTQKAKEAEIIKEQVKKNKDRAEHIVKDIEVEKDLAEQKLVAAKPALEEAEEALNTIKPANIATVRKLGRPPHLIMRVMDCAMILFRCASVMISFFLDFCLISNFISLFNLDPSQVKTATPVSGPNRSLSEA